MKRVIGFSRVWCILTFCLLLLFYFNNICQSVPQWDVNFNSMAVNQAPDTSSPTAGQANTEPTSYSGSVTVKSSFTVGSESLSDTPVEFANSSSTEPQLIFDGLYDDYEAKVNYRLEFDLLIDGTDASGTVFGCFFYRIGTSVPLAGMSLATSNQRLVLTTSHNDGYQISKSFYNQWQANDLMHVVLFVDAANGKFSCWIDGWLAGEVDIAASYEYQGVDKIVIKAGSLSGSGDFAVDNIESISVTTEAITRWQVNFNHMDANQEPNTMVVDSNLVLTEPTSYSENGINNSIEVKDSFIAGGASLQYKPLVFDKQSTGSGTIPEVEFSCHYSDYEVGKIFELQFDLLVKDQYTGDSSVFGVVLRRLGTGTPVGSVALSLSNDRVTLSSSENGSPGITNTENFLYAWDPNSEEIMSWKILFDPGHNVLNLSIDNSDNEYDFIGSVELAPVDPNQGVQKFSFTGGSTSVTSNFAVDNIRASFYEIVPESVSDVMGMGFILESDFNGDCYVTADDNDIIFDQTGNNNNP